MKGKYMLLAAAMLSMLSCRREPSVQDGVPPVQAPIVRLSEEIAQDAVLVKFSSALSEEERLEVEDGRGVSLQKIFPSTPGKEELERRFGLDRWYEATLREDEDVHGKARELSRLGRVELVQYASIAQRQASPAFTAAFPQDTRAEAASVFNDPYLSMQWHYRNNANAAVSPKVAYGADINVTDVWAQLSCGDPEIIVAVVDEGVKYTHPDLRDNMWMNPGEIFGNGIDDDGNGYVDDVYGYNFVTNGPVSWDTVDSRGIGDSGHGTHCAGIIAAVNNNGKGVSGVAGGSGKGDGCRIMSCQIFSGAAGGSSSITGRAIKYAADMGASVLSCSFGYGVSFTSDDAYVKSVGSVEIDAVHYFEATCNNPVIDGGIAVFAAGNDGHAYAHYPGAYHDIISVSAFGPDGLPTYYSNYGPGCNISAPGGEAYHAVNRWESMVLSTIPSEIPSLGFNGDYNKTGLDYGYMQGTSMACPHVSGIVALGLSYAKKLGKTFRRDEFKQMILSSVNDIDSRIGASGPKTYAYSQKDLPLGPYYHQMGTGAIDAWRLMMHIEGLPTLTAQTGRQQWIDLTAAFGTASVSLTYIDVSVPAQTVESLGLQKIRPEDSGKYPATEDAGGYAYVQFGRLYIHPTKIGSGKIHVSAVGGGDHLGGGGNPPGGMEMCQEISLIARDADGGNGTGGWL